MRLEESRELPRTGVPGMHLMLTLGDSSKKPNIWYTPWLFEVTKFKQDVTHVIINQLRVHVRLTCTAVHAALANIEAKHSNMFKKHKTWVNSLLLDNR